jgi:hypothetical protein
MALFSSAAYAATKMPQQGTKMSPLQGSILPQLTLL